MLVLNLVFLQYSFSIPSVFLQYSFGILSIFFQYSFSIPSVFLQYSFSIPSVFFQYSFNIPSQQLFSLCCSRCLYYPSGVRYYARYGLSEIEVDQILSFMVNVADYTVVRGTVHLKRSTTCKPVFPPLHSK